MFLVVVLRHKEWTTSKNSICDSCAESQSQKSVAPLVSKFHLKTLTDHPQIQV